MKTDQQMKDLVAVTGSSGPESVKSDKPVCVFVADLAIVILFFD